MAFFVRETGSLINRPADEVPGMKNAYCAWDALPHPKDADGAMASVGGVGLGHALVQVSKNVPHAPLGSIPHDICLSRYHQRHSEVKRVV